MRAIVLLVTLSGGAWAHQGHTAPAPWTACAHADLGDACAWENDAHDVYRGTCRSMSQALVCVRNRPIERATAAPPAPEAMATPEPAALRPSRVGGPLAIGASAVCILLLGFGLRTSLRRDAD